MSSIFDALYAFFSTAIGINYCLAPPRYEHDSEADFDPIESHGVLYVPRFTATSSAMSSRLASRISSSRPEVVLLRQSHECKEGYNLGLMVDGPRHTFVLNRDGRGTIPCFVAWCRYDGSLFNPVAESGKTQVFAARSARGVVFAYEVSREGSRGMPVQLIAHFMGLEFRILDKDPAKDDIMKIVEVFHQHQSILDPTKEFVPWIHQPGFEFDEVWFNLVEVARQGYEESFGAPLDPRQMEKFFFFQHQLSAYRMHADRLRQEMKRMSWQSALNFYVVEPWQLAVALEAHLVGDAFMMPMQTSRRERFANMLAHYTASDEKKKRLWQMVDQFAAVHNPRFNF